MNRALKLVALTALLVAVAPSTAPAATPVHIETHEMVELTSNNALAIQVHTSMGEMEGWRCHLDWEAVIDEDGYVHMHSVQLGPQGSTQPLCVGNTGCPDFEWHGQIFKDEVTGGTKINFAFCIEPVVSISGDVTCDITSTAMHCDDAAVEGYGGTVEFDGEMSFSEPITVVEI